jgi:hypothetical protein
MKSSAEWDVGAAFDDDERVDRAVAAAYADAARRHKQAGVPLVVCRDGKLTEIPPDEIEIPGESGREAA